ncbi:MAG: hypothetical protein ACR2H2_00070 [Solirubrobacteraceae bacterium]
MRKPLPLVLGLVAVVVALMLGGWALTSGTPDVPRGSTPAAGSDADAKRDAAGGHEARSGSTGQRTQQAGQGTQARERKQADAVGADAAKAEGAAQSIGGPSDDGSERARRDGGERAQRLRAEQAREAEQRRQSDATRRSAERRRAEQLRQENAARQAQAARRAEEAKRAQEDSPDEQRTHDGPEEE